MYARPYAEQLYKEEKMGQRVETKYNYTACDNTKTD